MKDNLLLNEILQLNKNDLLHTRIGLNMHWDNKSHFSRWYESDPKNRDVSFNYYSTYNKQSNYFVNDYSFGFVRLPNNPDLWLLVTAGKITNVPQVSSPGQCSYEVLEKYRHLFGKLIMHYHKGNKNSRYVFKAQEYINEMHIETILDEEYKISNPNLMNRKVFLQPYGKADDSEHFINSINKPRHIKEFIGYVDDETIKELKELYPSDEIGIWGILPGESNNPNYEKMNVGDLVLFNREKNFFASCVVVKKIRNKSLAMSLFGESGIKGKEHETFELIYFFKNICLIDIDNPTFNSLINRKPNKNVQGFECLDIDDSYKVLSSLDVSPICQKENKEDADNEEVVVELIEDVQTTNRIKSNPRKQTISNTSPDFNKIAAKKSTIGLRGEQFVLDYEKSEHPDKADQIISVGEYPTYGYDIKSVFNDGTEKHIEVKTCSTGSPDKIDFFITNNELDKLNNDPCYVIYFVCKTINKTRKIIVLKKSNLDELDKEPIAYRIHAKMVK